MDMGAFLGPTRMIITLMKKGQMVHHPVVRLMPTIHTSFQFQSWSLEQQFLETESLRSHMKKYLC